MFDKYEFISIHIYHDTILKEKKEKNMGREEFLNSIKVDQSVKDNLYEISTNHTIQNENGQYTRGDTQQEIAHTTGFDRDGDILSEPGNIQEGIENGTNKGERASIEGAIDTGVSGGIEGGLCDEIDGGIDSGMDM